GGGAAYGMKGVELSQDRRSVIKEALAIEGKYNIAPHRIEAILAALVSPGVGFTSEQLKTMPLKADKVIALISGSPSSARTRSQTQLGTNTVKESTREYCYPLLQETSNCEIIGFGKEIRSCIEVLARKDRANILIIGEIGVGKTSLIQGLITLARESKLPTSIANIEPYELDLISLSQGVSYKGEIEDRFKSTVESLRQKQQPVLVIENFQRIEDRQSLLNGILPNVKKLLSGSEIQLICTTTIDGYTKDIEKDKDLIAYFEKITIEAPSEEQATEILESKKSIYEQFHNLPIGRDVIAEIVRLAKRYMPERNLPSSAIDLLDRSMASVKVDNEMSEEGAAREGGIILSKEDVRGVVSKMTGIPMGSIQSEEMEKLSKAEDTLHKHVVGQDHAIKSVLDAIFESRSGLNKKGQPMGSFFFLGPTGTGKTELAKSLADFLFNDEASILRFDMSEYKEEHSVALLYGAPPGYVGYEEGGLLVNQIRQHPYSVVLFDEIEKAHRSVFDLFLQILDEGKLHDRLGRVGDFSNSLIIFTSNIGSDYIFKSFEGGIVPTHDKMLEVMQGQFRPEFLARLTEIIPFSPITSEMIDRIFDIHIKNLLKTLKEQNITLEIDSTAREYVTKVGFNAHYGARPILGIIRKEIRRPLSKLIISREINEGDTVTMKYDDEKKEITWEIDTPE
ncbi:MAG: ATP-dependent Clp protease ATP-binding subunit, partial [Prevotella sp.]|nr:ATP-dependent Clp protease ATP-binding subunit [Prevotella sp.]